MRLDSPYIFAKNQRKIVEEISRIGKNLGWRTNYLFQKGKRVAIQPEAIIMML